MQPVQEISKKLHEIELHMPKLLRYLFRYSERLLIPPEYCNHRMAEEALEKARYIQKLTVECLEKLKTTI